MVHKLAPVFLLSLALGACIEPTPVSQCNDAAFKIEAEYTACEQEIPDIDCESFRGLECDVKPYLDCLVEQVKCEDSNLSTGDPSMCANLLECTPAGGTDSATTGTDTTGDTDGTDTTG